ncbi:MAG: hypothetical protein IJ811_00240 [Clostridia bacterium]|nr:hypothetical protein [Clostridia bacterium]
MILYDDLKTMSAIFSAKTFTMLLLTAVINVVLLSFLARKFMQIIQQSGYAYADYVKWTKKKNNVYITRLGMMVMLSVLSYLIYSIALSFADVNWVAPTGFLFYLLFAVIFARSDIKRKSKSPLVYTPRLIRIYITFSLITFAVSFAVLLGCAALGVPFAENDILFRVRFVPIFLTPLLVPALVAFANAINTPIERVNNKKYVEKCKQTLSEYPDLIKIGITGSYGKTSVKEILKVLLSEKYKVLATPFSYNTPMGICKSVKRLDETYDVFIAEMGARHEGDIKELCDIVHPSYAIINGIIEHHMDTFSSINQIKKTKFELVRGLEKGGTAILTCDNEHTLSMAGEEKDVKIVLAGLNLSARPSVYATEVKPTKYGCSFTLHLGGETAKCHSKLIGEHNVSNVMLASALCYELGLSIGEIAAGISRLTPISHRLEVTENEAGVTIIDDSYNSNVSGTVAALKVLSGYDGRKIVVTPGMVELGKNEDRENYELGRRLAKVVDYAIIVSSGGAYLIRDGLLAEDFPLEKIYMAKDLADAMDKYKSMSASGDVLLFENDLPDKFL